MHPEFFPCNWKDVEEFVPPNSFLFKSTEFPDFLREASLHKRVTWKIWGRETTV